MELGLFEIKKTISTTALPGGARDTAYSYTLAATGDPIITWTLDNGQLPDGLSLLSNGTISGTPSKTGTFTFTVKAVNDAGSHTRQLSITISIASLTSVQAAQAPALKAWAQHSTLRVSGLAAGKPWSVYSTTGSLVYHGVAESDEAEVALPMSGVYIVQSGRQVVKVAVQRR